VSHSLPPAIYSSFAALFAIWAISPAVFWAYFALVTILAVGLPVIIVSDFPRTRGFDRVVPFGRLFYAIPLAVFGTEHFTSSKDIAAIVPSWMPAPVFWTLFVGVCLCAAALSLASKVQAPLAAALAGLMLFLFVLMMHIPNLRLEPKDRILWAVALRDLSFSGGALAFAAGRIPRLKRLLPIGVYFVALPTLFFAVEQILHPDHVPAIPLEKVTAAWVPGHIFWSYLTGVVFLATGIAILAKFKARMAATCLGVMTFVAVLFVYVPTWVVNPTDIPNELNFVVDTLMFGGAALLLADALPQS
jgi:uncharacterized membrane protein